MIAVQYHRPPGVYRRVVVLRVGAYYPRPPDGSNRVGDVVDVVSVVV